MVRTVVLDNPPALTDGERASVAARYADPIEIGWDGSHLIKLWHATRDQELYWPWYERTREAVRDNDPDIDPGRLTTEVHAYLKNHETYAETWRAILSFPLAETIGERGKAFSIYADPNARFARHARLVGGEGFQELPASAFAKARSILDRFERS